MSDVLVYERAAATFAAGLAKRGHHVVYRMNASNHCPGCGRSQWYIGRASAECGFCGTAVPLAETAWQPASPRGGQAAPASLKGSVEERQHPRMPTDGRKLQLLIDGSPTSFALHNISEGGVMGDGVPNLIPGAKVHVRFEGGIFVPAEVKWADNDLVGLAFLTPIMLDRSAKPAN